jgi:CDP-diacylglycerol pyrophosphatase
MASSGRHDRRLDSRRAIAGATHRSLALCALLGCAAVLGARADEEPAPDARDRLRYLVQQQCIPHWLQEHDPAPCVSVGVGFALLPDRKGGAHFLLIPTATIRGIESPEARAPGAVNYFDAAWSARAALAGRIGHSVPRAAVGLAVNSIRSRSQDQLHIHVSCLRAEVARALAGAAEAIGSQWEPLELDGHSYRAMRLMGEHLGAANPFGLLAWNLDDADKSMAEFTLLLAGFDFKEGPGFVLLAGHAVPGAELMLDPHCALAVGAGGTAGTN